jgi:hypothetical protein
MEWRHTDVFGYHVLAPLVHTGGYGDWFYHDANLDASLFVLAALQGGP